MEKKDWQFPTTHWTLIARLKGDDAVESQKALDELCAQYHYPLYCYIRWRGLNHHDAQDALHDFLSKLLRLDSLKTADMEKGRLRTFLATALQRFLINLHRAGHHRRQEVSMDAADEGRFLQEQFASELTPEKVLERSWATTLLQHALNDLEEAEADSGKGAQFKVLQPFLSPDGEGPGYERAAIELGQNEGTIRQMVKRLREKFRTHLRRRVAETLACATGDEIDLEMKALRAALMD